MSPERRAKGGLGCPVSHPEHGDTLILRQLKRQTFLIHRLKKTVSHLVIHGKTGADDAVALVFPKNSLGHIRVIRSPDSCDS
ncbi:MAG: hypothetical protein [Olavius algarvensis Gamma 1 endosymbiont]|nr:MAG: hypothetical protein [Olavius algarvensis Gamma 1 endosymbiont]